MALTPSSRTSRLKRPRSHKAPSPFVLALLMGSAIFICEAAVMFLLNFLPPLSHTIEAIIDSSILLAFLMPFYFFLYRPFWSQHKRYEKEIQHLSQKLLSSAEEERKRISHDLHDQCGQTLTAIQFAMDVLRKSMPEHHSLQKDQVKDIIAQVSRLGNELRDVTQRLRPAMLDEINLVSALESLVAEFSNHHPDVSIQEDYSLGEITTKLSSDIEVALYRTCQESLTNVIKYSQATELSVILELQGDDIVLSVQDNGIGFDAGRLGPGIKHQKGVGILGMRERVFALNGEFDIRSEPGKGTTVMIALPLGKDHNGEED